MRSSCTISTRLDHRTTYPRPLPVQHLSFFFPFFSFLFPISFYARRGQLNPTGGPLKGWTG